MKPPLRPAHCRRPAALGAALFSTLAALAFPPAPHHQVYGLVRDELGNPLNAPGAQVLLESEGTSAVRSTISIAAEPGVNYRLNIPLDSGATPDLYKPSALRPAVPFRMRVQIGNATYLPIEMIGVSKLFSRPGESSRVDLTLGIDSDGDGLPDAWELALIAASGGTGTLADIGPKDDTDGDGLNNLGEYLAGTYAFDPADGFALAIASAGGGRSLLEFTAIRGRSYFIQASPDMANWTPVTFTVSTDPANAPQRGSYVATDVRPVQALVGPFDDATRAARFFRLIVQ